MKKLLALVLAVLTALSVVGCGTPAPTEDTTAATDASQTTDAPEAATDGIDLSQKEAPELAEQVAAGKLPALEDRLPVASDIMVEEVKAFGRYGGSMTITTADNNRWTWGPYTEQGLFRFKDDLSGQVEPNVCKAFSSNEDSTVWTIQLREGMKWSDGEPLTADDFIFYYDHMSTPALNEDRTAVAPEAEGYHAPFTSKIYKCYQVEIDGKSYWAKYDKVNDYEFTVTFAAPKPSFPEDFEVDAKWGVMAKHFYKNYVSRKDGITDDPTFPYITEEEALANANRDFGKNWEAYGAMGKSIGYYNWDYAIVPQLRSFIAVKDNWDTVGETYKLVRNPYFWKTDSEGRQLPYLDSFEVKIINEPSQVTLQAMSGAFDFYIANTDFSTVGPELKDSHHVVEWNSAEWSATFDNSNAYNICLNQTVKDLDKRALFQDKRFREALSICVDRNLMNETLLNGISEPWQASAVGANESWSKKWTEYDVDRANQLLDELTEPWNHEEGTYRKMKGTDRDVEIIVTVSNIDLVGDYLALLESAYKNIGVKLSTKVMADMSGAQQNNDVEADIHHMSSSTPALRPDEMVPCRNISVWCSGYGKWYEDGKTESKGGIEPPQEIKDMLDALERLRAATGPDRTKIVQECVNEIYRIHEDNIYIIGYLKPAPYKFLVSNDLMNFPEGLMQVDEFRFIGLARPETFWKAQ